MAGRVLLAPKGFRRIKAALDVTPTAKERLQYLMQKKADEKLLGIRLGVKKRGCNGLAYTMNYATDKKATDEIVKIDDKFNIFIDPQALLTVIGTQMDYKEDTLVSEFTFINPNATSACGCGESFKV